MIKVAKKILFGLFFVKIMKHIVKHQVVTVLVLSQILNKLRSMSANSFDCLEYIHLTMLDNLFDASVGSTVDPTP